MQNASSLACHCKNSKLQKAGLLPMRFPCHWYRGTRDVLPLNTAPVYLDSNTPSEAGLCVTCVCVGGGGGTTSEKGGTAYQQPKRQVSEWSCICSAQELSDLSHARTHAYSSFVGKSMPFLSKNKCVGLWSISTPRRPHPPL